MARPERLAALDCGTNSLRLLVAEVPPDGGPLVDVVRRMEVVRLGEGVDRTGEFAAAALERTFSALEDYVRVLRGLDVARVRMVATSATRDVSNRDAFIDGVIARLGVAPDVIDGDEEARLSFTGAVASLPAEGYDERFLVADIGGGSTELVLGRRTASGPTVSAARSVDIGCVRMTERHLRDDPPTQQQVEAARRDVRAALDDAAGSVPLDQAATVIGLAGSVTTVAAIALSLTSYDAERIHLSRISSAQVASVTTTLLAQTRAERAASPVMHPGRVDVIGGGALVLDELLRRCGADSVVVSERDILDGIAASLLTPARS